MKNPLLVLSSLLIATAFSPFMAANDENHADTIRLTARPFISTGMTRETVHAMFGVPSARLAADGWVYFDSKPANAVAIGTQNSAAEKKDTLVVVFQHDRVSLIRACDSAPVRVLLAQQEKSKRTSSTIAAK